MFLSPIYLRWMIVILAYSIALCFIQLFHILAFEFSFAIALLFSFAFSHLGMKEYHYSQEQLFHRESIVSIWMRASLSNSILALIPLLPITLNGLRVRNCNWLDGFLFYLLIPMVTVWVATGWGVILAYFKRGFFGFILFFLGTVAWGLWLFYSTPTVDIFHIFLGYYPGAIYDEEMILGLRLILSRVEDLVWVLLFFSLIQMMQQAESIKKRFYFALYLCGVMGMYWTGIQFDLHRSELHVQTRLGAQRESELFVFYYPKKWDEQQIDLIQTDFEFAHLKLKAFFKKAPNRKIKVYLYNDLDMKKRLMGAGSTLIAKPWQFSIHLNQVSIGADVVLHELSHIFATEFADHPFYISMNGLIPQMPLIEGVAEAATWDGERLNHHQWSAAIKQLNFAPPMKELLSPEQFYLHNGQLAYTLCGSFIRFYTEKTGIQHLESFYRRGAIDGGEEGLNTEIQAWESMLSQIKLSPQVEIYAKEFFNRPAIFKKICAHEMANLRRKAQKLHGKKLWSEALDQWHEILKYQPLDTMANQKKMEIYFQLNDIKALTQDAHQILASENATSAIKRKSQEWLLDLSEISDADMLIEDYQKLLNDTFDRGDMRRLSTKMELVKKPEVRQNILGFLLGIYEIDQMLAEMKKLVDQYPNWGLVHYLYARVLLMKNLPKDAFTSFESALRLGLTHPSLIFEAELKRAELLFNEKEYLRSASLYEMLSQRKDLQIEEGERFHLKQWQERALFFSRKRLN